MQWEGNQFIFCISILQKTTVFMSDGRDTPLIEPQSGLSPIFLIPGSDRISSPPLSRSGCFIGWSDLSPAIGTPPGPRGCTDKASRGLDALRAGPYNKADGWHYTPCVLSGTPAQAPRSPSGALSVSVSSLGFSTICSELCARVTSDLCAIEPESAQFVSPPRFPGP